VSRPNAANRTLVARLLVPRLTVLRLLVLRLRWVLVVLCATVLISTVGFVALAQYSWFDALYMTVITLGTIGYGEVKPLDNVGRLWAMTVISAGFGVLVYSGSTLTSLLISGDLKAALARQRSARMSEGLKSHVIIVGFGRVGRAVTVAALRQGQRCVVVDADEGKDRAIREAGAIPVFGDGMQEEVLLAAGIARARALVAAGPDDPANLVVTLTARALCPDLRIVARVNDPDWQQRILRAGASEAVSPYGDFGTGLAASALGADLVETTSLTGYGLRTEDVIVSAGSRLIGQRSETLSLDHANTMFVVMRRASVDTAWERTDTEIQVGDVVVVLGPDETVAGLGNRLG
jgi:voltage-gated potassium channel